MKPWTHPAGLPAPCRVEVTWLVREGVSVALDWDEHNEWFTTSVYYYDERLPLSEETHTFFSVAVEEVGRLLAGGWRDYFDDQILARLDADKEQP